MAAQDKWVTFESVITTDAHNPRSPPTPQRCLYECFVRLWQSCIRCVSPEDDTTDGQQVILVPEEESKRGYEGTTSLVPGPEDNVTADGQQVIVVHEEESKRGYEGTTSLVSN